MAAPDKPDNHPQAASAEPADAASTKAGPDHGHGLSGQPGAPTTFASTIKFRLARWRRVIRRLLPREVILIVVAVVAMVIITAFFTVALQLYALSHPNKSAYAAKPDIFGLSYQDVTLHTADGVTVDGWFVTAKVKTDATIIVFHGNASNKSEMLPRLAFLASRYNLLFLDMRYFGSGGGYTTYGLKEVSEARAALNWLKGQGVKTVGLYGYSTGGTVALL